jgi:hypothetical protein
MTYKSLSLEELKNNYSDRHGFIFQGNSPSSRENCEKLYRQLKMAGVSDYEPDFINELHPTIFAFVYPDGTKFKSADLYEFATHASMMTAGMYKLDILSAFLKEH